MPKVRAAQGRGRGRPSGRLPGLALVVLVLGGACAEPPERDRSRILVAAIAGDPGHLNPAITTGGGVHTASGLLYDGLLTLDEDMNPGPALARSWEVLDDGRRYRFHLRNDVLWHDGVPFTSHDVVFTFRELLLRYHARTRASMEPALASVEAPDDHTVEFRFREPYAPLLQQLDVVEAPILPRHVYQGEDPLRHPANLSPVGTGPFRFVSYRSDAEIRYEANADYFGGSPSLGSVVLRVIPDEDTQVVALETGEVDWLFGVPGPHRERLDAHPEIRLLRTTVNPGGSNCIMTVGFNLERPVLGDVRVRRALAHAVDREQIHERVQFGSGRVADAPISSGIPFAHARGLGLPAHDTAAAGRLLEEAGWRRDPDGVRRASGVDGVPNGAPLSLGFKAFPTQAPYGNLLRAQLRAIGVDLRLEILEPAVLVGAVFTDRDFDTAIFSYCNGPDPEIGVRRMYHSANVVPIPFSNAAGYRNPRVDALFDRAGATLDPEERGRLYREIQEILVEELPYLGLVESEAVRGHTARCTGFGHASHFAARARCDR